MPADAGPATLELTTNSSSQTLTNKTINAANNTVTTSAGELNQALTDIQDDIDTRALDSDLTSHESDKNTHGVTGDIVGTSDTQTLTNKSIDAADNTITDLNNDNIAEDAGIDASKIADGSVSNTEFQYLNGVTSDIQNQLNNKAFDSALSSHTLAHFDVHGVTGDVVGDSDYQTLSNKLFSDPVGLTEISTPDTPSSGTVALYAKADGNIYKKADDGVEEQVNGGGGVNAATTNLVINGGMEVYQRNNTVTISAASTAAYRTADRFLTGYSGAVSATESVVTDDVPEDAGVSHALKIQKATGNIITVSHFVEGKNLLSYVGQSVVVSAWVKTSLAATDEDFWFGVYTPDTEDTYANVGGANNVTEVDVNYPAIDAGTWTRISKVITVPNARGLSLYFRWDNNVPGTEMLITGVMVTPGGTLPSRFYRHGADFGAELIACQRYFEKSAPQNTPANQGSSGNAIFFVPWPGVSNLNGLCSFLLRVQKRVVPSVTIYSPNSGTSNRIRQAGIDYTVSLSITSEHSFIVINGTGSSWLTSTNGAASCHYFADAEIKI